MILQDYYKCAHFIMLLSLFEEDGKLTQEWEQKYKYCKLKSALGQQFLNKGINLGYGNPFVKKEMEMFLLKEKTSLKDKQFNENQKMARSMTISHKPS